MDTTAVFQFNVVGDTTGNPYTGKFKVKTVLSRRDSFLADERRRILIGANANSVSPSVGAEAFMLGQLFVRIVDAPAWWTQSDAGLDIEDGNVITDLFSAVVKAEEERVTALKAESQKMIKKMAGEVASEG